MSLWDVKNKIYKSLSHSVKVFGLIKKRFSQKGIIFFQEKGG